MRGLAQKSEVHAFKTGDIIFKADDPGASMFGVLEGSVRLSWKNDEGNEGYELIHARHNVIAYLKEASAE